MTLKLASEEIAGQILDRSLSGIGSQFIHGQAKGIVIGIRAAAHGW